MRPREAAFSILAQHATVLDSQQIQSKCGCTCVRNSNFGRLLSATRKTLNNMTHSEFF